MILPLNIVSSYTYREIIKSKIVVAMILCCAGLGLLTFVARELTYGVPERIALDIGVGLLGLTSSAMALFLGLNLITKDIDSRTVYMILSRPITRSQFITGRILGVFLILVTNVFILTIFTYGIVTLLGGPLNSLFWWAAALSLIESLIVLSLVVFFTLFANQTLTVIYTIVVYIVGHTYENLANISFAKNSDVIMILLKGMQFLVPNFSKLNIKDYLIYQSHIPNSIIFTSLIYGVLYLIALFSANIFIFSKKQLD